MDRAVQRVLSRVEFVGEALADDDHPLRAFFVAVIEIAALQNRDAHGGKESRRDRPEFGAVRIAAGFLLLGARGGELEVDIQSAVVAPGSAETFRGVFHTRQRRHAAFDVAVKVPNLLLRFPIRHHRQVDGHHLG